VVDADKPVGDTVDKRQDGDFLPAIEPRPASAVDGRAALGTAA
jgi:hypothetical protein